MSDARKETPSQTAGPYVHIGLAPGAAGFQIYETELGQDIAGPDAEGMRIRIEGTVFDGTGSPVRDVLIEAWQADANGHYPHPADGGAVGGFRGFGRAISDFKTGEWSFDTIKPGSVAGRSGALMAPHINLWIVARGINLGLHTRLYFADDAAAIDKDPVLNLIEWDNRLQTLIAARADSADAGAVATYRFDIHLQGAHETVFFDI